MNWLCNATSCTVRWRGGLCSVTPRGLLAAGAYWRTLPLPYGWCHALRRRRCYLQRYGFYAFAVWCRNCGYALRDVLCQQCYRLFNGAVSANVARDRRLAHCRVSGWWRWCAAAALAYRCRCRTRLNLGCADALPPFLHASACGCHRRSAPFSACHLHCDA